MSPPGALSDSTVPAAWAASGPVFCRKPALRPASLRTSFGLFTCEEPGGIPHLPDVSRAVIFVAFCTILRFLALELGFAILLTGWGTGSPHLLLIIRDSPEQDCTYLLVVVNCIMQHTVLPWYLDGEATCGKRCAVLNTNPIIMLDDLKYQLTISLFSS